MKGKRDQLTRKQGKRASICQQITQKANKINININKQTRAYGSKLYHINCLKDQRFSLLIIHSPVSCYLTPIKQITLTVEPHCKVFIHTCEALLAILCI